MKSVTDPRHNSRRLALGALFCWLFSDNPENESCVLTAKDLLGIDEEALDRPLADLIVKGVGDNKKDIDEIIQDCAPDWPIEKISKVDLIILRISVFELLYSDHVPDKVVIDEAVELAKEFGGDTSGKFVNGVLGTVVDIKNKTNLEEKEIENG
jgi:N utilization substance protein B